MIKKILLFILKWLVALAILAVVCYYAINVTMTAFVNKKADITVPNLHGLTLNDCLDTLAQANLAVIKEGSEFNQNVPAGVVIRQIPPAGINVKEGKVIRVTLSQGGEIVYVPNLITESLRSANIALKSAGLILGEITKKASAKYEEGIVLGQDPLPGTIVDKDTSVNLLLSNGAPENGTVLMPDWIGKGAIQAKQWAVGENYEVELIAKNTKTANPGEIFDQFPKADDEIKEGTKIIFYIADDESKLELRETTFSYNVPNAGGTKRIKLVLSDETGEKNIFDGTKDAGSQLSIPVKAKGRAVVKVFINNVSIEDIPLND